MCSNEYLPIIVSRCISQQDAKQYGLDGSRCDRSSATFRYPRREATLEREDRKEQEGKARTVALRSLRLKLPESWSLVKCVPRTAAKPFFSERLQASLTRSLTGV